MAASLSLISPAGRIVAGSVSKPSLKDMKGKERAKPQYFFALAIPKTDPAVQAMLGQFWNLAIETVFNNPRATPALKAAINEWLRPKSGFAWKIDDGDNPKYADRPGYAGCWIVKYTTTFALRCYDRDARPIPAESVKTGYYADVAMSVSHNGYFDDQAGLYVNPNMVRLLGYGEEIQAGPNAAQVFGAAPAPVMGSQMPVAPSGGMAPPAQQQAYAPPAQQQSAPGNGVAPIAESPGHLPAGSSGVMGDGHVTTAHRSDTGFTPPRLPDVGAPVAPAAGTEAPAPTPATASGASDSGEIVSPGSSPLVGFATGEAQ